METVIRDVEPLFTILYEALEAGTLRAAEFFADEDRPVDKTLFPHLVRYYAGLVLREKSEAIGELQVEEVPNNGLSLVWHRYRIRIWKSTDGELPYPGNSQVKQAFLRQQHFVFDTPVQEPVVEINLAVLWEVDFNYRLRQLWLVQPKADPSGEAPIEAECTYVIPHPALAPKQSNEALHGLVEDLPLELADDEVKKVGGGQR